MNLQEYKKAILAEANLKRDTTVDVDTLNKLVDILIKKDSPDKTVCCEKFQEVSQFVQWADGISLIVKNVNYNNGECTTVHIDYCPFCGREFVKGEDGSFRANNDT